VLNLRYNHILPSLFCFSLSAPLVSFLPVGMNISLISQQIFILSLFSFSVSLSRSLSFFFLSHLSLVCDTRLFIVPTFVSFILFSFFAGGCPTDF
jgi:hypothetical protein